ncbi:hypothetical protein GQ457_04G032660 [Hibiscus cannabinus]
MNMYGFSTPEVFPIDDLLDLSNEEIFSPASASTNNDNFPPSETPFTSSAAFLPSFSDNDFTHDLCLPSDDVAELEWLSQFVDDSFSDFPSNSLAGTFNPRNDHHSSFSSKAWSKRSRAPTTTSKTKRGVQSQASPAAAEGGVRRCTHCASEKTPQWRTGPLGPKTLCNACGVRYKSGRLVPEYRPAASPTFMLTQHSNSHRKVLELRRQKELSRQQQEHEIHNHHHHHRRQQHDFEVC